jgi:transglutaminase superfamily protein
MTSQEKLAMQRDQIGRPAEGLASRKEELSRTPRLPEALAYYATPGPFTELAGHASRVRELPAALQDLCHVVQGLVVHPFLAHLYGLAPQSLRQDELQVRHASQMLDRILALDANPLSEARPPERRFVGNCRHFTVLLCALLRARGVPARARCGFGLWFNPPGYEDHWVCEVWDEARGLWYLVDAQLDAIQCKAFRLSFDPLDVPRTQFLVAGDAWQRCRRGQAEPQRFGILDIRGLWFVRGNLVRDLAACAKRELLPWDGWGFADKPVDPEDSTELAVLDRVAELTQADASAHEEMLELYDSNIGLRVPRIIMSFGPGGDAPVDLGPGVVD